MNARLLTKISMLAAMAIILHIFEGMIPLPIPGVKLGFANIITLAAIALVGFGNTLLVVIIRTSLSGLLTGSFLTFGFLMSFSSGITSATVMALLYAAAKRSSSPSFSLIGISIAGALTHNITQLFVASLIMSTSAIFYYLPVMLISSIPTGILIGLLAKLLLPRLQTLLNP